VPVHHHRQTLFRQCNASCRCSRYAPAALLDMDFEAPELKPASKYTSTTNVLLRLRAYRSQAGRRPTRAGGRRGAQAAPRTPGTVGSALLCSAACARRCLRATTCPPHVRRLRASLACLPAAARRLRPSGVDDDWTRAPRCGSRTGRLLCYASCRKYFLWDTCHAMHADGCPTHGTGGWAACLLRLHCSIPPPIQSLLPARGPGRALPAIFAWSTQKAHTTREERGPGKRYPPRAVLAGGSPRRLRERPDIVT
jgi:hypothetical protein